MPVFKLSEVNKERVFVLTGSKIMIFGKNIYEIPQIVNYDGNYQVVLATQDELAKAPWDMVASNTGLMVKFSQTKEIGWRPFVTTPRLSWLCEYLPNS